MAFCEKTPGSSVQSLSHVRLFATPWTATRQASLPITTSRSLLKLKFIWRFSKASLLPGCSWLWRGCFPSCFATKLGRSLEVGNWSNLVKLLGPQMNLLQIEMKKCMCPGKKFGLELGSQFQAVFPGCFMLLRTNHLLIPLCWLMEQCGLAAFQVCLDKDVCRETERVCLDRKKKKKLLNLNAFKVLLKYKHLDYSWWNLRHWRNSCVT